MDPMGAAAAAAAARLRSRFVSSKPSAGLIAAYVAIGLVLAALAAFLVYRYALGSPTHAPRPSLSDCAYGDWSALMGCDAGTPAECGQGVGVRVRTVRQEASGGGAPCDEAAMLDVQLCTTLNAAACAERNCSYTAWSPWSPCPSFTCEGSTGASGGCGPQPMSTRNRAIAHEAQPGGVPCDALTLFEYAPCQGGVACPGPVDCVPEAWGDVWSGCPADACTLPGQPVYTAWEYQTRGVAVAAANGGKDCSPSAFLRSRSCAAPPPCSSCTVLAWGAWSECDVPCSTPAHGGTTWREADTVEPGSYYFCDSTQVAPCPGLGACPVGAFAPPEWGVVCSAAAALPASAFAPLPPSASLYDALALCAETAGCAGVNWFPATPSGGGGGSSGGSTTHAGTTGRAVLLGAVDGAACPAGGGGSASALLFAWDPASANCVPPTWPMLDAECLNLCSANSEGLPARGRVYPFAGDWMPDGVTPALSCPVTLDLLGAAGACKPDASGHFTAASCPGSTDCAYQAWADAGPWSACDAACGYASGGGGSRVRTRAILAPPTFMGAPCTPDEVTQAVACNAPAGGGGGAGWTPAPGMTCAAAATAAPSGSPAPGGTVLSAAACAAAAAAPVGAGPAAHAAAAAYSWAAADTLVSAQAAGQQLFYAGWTQPPTPTPTPATTGVDVIALLAAAGRVDARYGAWRLASLDELIVAQAAGASWCVPGVVSGALSAAASPSAPTFWPQAAGAAAAASCPGAGSGTGPGGSVLSAGPAGGGGSGGARGAVWVGVKPPASSSAVAELAAAGVTVLPFSSTGWDMPAPLPAALAAAGVCTLHADTLDTLLSGAGVGACAPARSALSLCADGPCAAETPCSLTAWVDEPPGCPACGPPFYSWQTRAFVAPATGGGTPCSAFATRQSVSCDPVPPACTALTSVSVYGPWPSTQAAGTAPCAAFAAAHVGAGVAFREAWDVPVQAAWIQLGAYDALNTYVGGSGGAAGVGLLPQDLAEALNTQCLADAGAAPTCVVTPAGNAYVMTGATDAANNFVYTGWSRTSAGAGGSSSGNGDDDACTPDAGWAHCLATRPSAPAPGLTFSPAAGAALCPSLCPYDPAQCAFGACTAGCAGGAGVEAMYRGVLQTAADFNPAELIWDRSCSGDATLPPCTHACPSSPDGTPCAQASGHGTCDPTTGVCSCQPGFETETCWFGCPVDSAGAVCSGRGSCTEGGTCACPAGWGGFDCSTDARLVLWSHADAVAGTAASGCIDDWTHCDRCDTQATLAHLTAVAAANHAVVASTDTRASLTGTTCEALGFVQAAPGTFLDGVWLPGLWSK